MASLIRDTLTWAWAYVQHVVVMFYWFWIPAFLVAGFLSLRYRPIFEEVTLKERRGPKAFWAAVGWGITSGAGRRASLEITSGLWTHGVPDHAVLAFLVASQNLVLYSLALFTVLIGFEFGLGVLLGGLVMIGLLRLTAPIWAPASDSAPVPQGSSARVVPETWRALLLSAGGWCRVLRDTGRYGRNVGFSLLGGLVLGATRARVVSTDELGSLAECFNAMAQSLQGTYAKLEEKNRRLEAALEKIQLLERAKEELSKFVPRSVRELVDEGGDSMTRQEGERDASVLFLDIAGYAQMSQAMEQPMVNYLVERYFSAYLDDIHANGGDVNETAGDGLMIIFQDDDRRRHAEAAVRTSVAIARKTDEINESLHEQGRPRVKVNIGINSGPASVGLRRFQGVYGERWTYTASGTTTNVAARLAAMARDGAILIGEATASTVKELISLRSLGQLSLKNVGEPVGVYRVLLGDDATRPPQAEALARCHAG